jgi:hypothetical protein
MGHELFGGLKMEVIIFDGYYKKLKHKTFTTIRNHYKNIKIGSNVECQVLNKHKDVDLVFYAKLEAIEVKTLFEVDDEVLTKDLDLPIYNKGYGDYINMSHVLSELNTFYPDLKIDDNVFIYYFKRK